MSNQQLIAINKLLNQVNLEAVTDVGFSDIGCNINGGVMNIGTLEEDYRINIGTNANTGRPIYIGNNYGATSVYINSGAGGINLDGSLTSLSPIIISNTATSTSTTTGSLIVAGGVGINDNLNVTNRIVCGSITSNGAQINLGTDSLTYSVNIATAGARPLNIGNASSTNNISGTNTISGVTTFNSSIRIANTILLESPNVVSSSTSSLALGDILRGIVLVTVSGSLTFPTAASLVAAVSNAHVNDVIAFQITTSSSGSVSSFVTNTGVSISAISAVSMGSNSARTFRIQFTNVTSGTEAYSVY